MSNLSALHTYPNGYEPEPVPEQAKVANQQEEVLGTLWQRWQASEADSAEAEEAFATQCHIVWIREKAQGSRTGKQGFKRILRSRHINERKAYKAMGKHFPQDFPKRPRPTTSTSLQRAAKSPKAHLPAADAEPPSNLEGLLLWSEGAVKPLLEQVCQGMPEAERVAALKQWFTAVAKYVLPDQLGYVTVGQRPGRRPQK